MQYKYNCGPAHVILYVIVNADSLQVNTFVTSTFYWEFRIYNSIQLSLNIEFK